MRQASALHPSNPFLRGLRVLTVVNVNETWLDVRLRLSAHTPIQPFVDLRPSQSASLVRSIDTDVVGIESAIRRAPFQAGRSP